MRILLVAPPVVFAGLADLAPPLGLLTLAAIVRERGYHVTVHDFNIDLAENPSLGGDRFYDYALPVLLEYSPDVVGFTSMCADSHVALRLAELVKHGRPNIITVLGGVHFSSIAPYLKSLGFVDHVVVGEGEEAFARLLPNIRPMHEVSDQPVLYNDLDSIPFPAYDLVTVERYLHANPRRLFLYEGGRGCVFKCAFCYSPNHYQHGVRHKPVGSVVRDLRCLNSLGAEDVFFVQDNFLNDRGWVLDLCTALADARIPISWNCYATLVQLDDAVIVALARAGCNAIFVGIDAVGRESQSRLGKRFYRSAAKAQDLLRACIFSGVVPTCAFILEGPAQDSLEIEATIQAALACRMLGCEVRLNALTHYPHTLIANEFEACAHYSETKVRLLLDVAPVVHHNPYAEAWPALFPYHATRFASAEWDVFLGKVHAAFTCLYAFPKTLESYTANGGNIWHLLNYIGLEYVELLLSTPPASRRDVAVQRFLATSATLFQSSPVADSLHYEAAAYTLSRYGRPKEIRIRTNMSFLATCLQPMVPIPTPIGTLRRVALRDDRSQQVREMLVSPALFGELERLHEVDSGTLVSVEAEVLELLFAEGWLVSA